MSYKWSSHELDILQELTGDLPWPLAVRNYNRIAKMQKFPVRTTTALRRICEKHGILRTPTGQWIRTGMIARMLDISYESVERWINAGWLPAQRFHSHRAACYYIRRSDLRAMARERPHLFGGQSASTLTQLLDSESLAEQITAMALPKPFAKVKVVCIETARRYPSIRAAARAAYVTPQRLATVLNCPTKTANNFHWKTAS